MANVVDYPAINLNGWLLAFADYLGDVKDTFYDIAVAINGVFLLGEYLMLPFYAVYSGLYYAEEKVRKANDFLQWAYHLSKNVYESGYINGIFNYFWSELAVFKADPIEFIRWKIASISYDYLYLMYYPLDFVRNKLYELDDRFYLLLNNPRIFFYDLFTYYGTEFAEFLTSPATYIRAKIASLSIEMTYLMYYPLDWLRLQLYTLDNRFYTLVNNPRQFFYDIVNYYNTDMIEVIEGPKHWLQNLLSDYLGLPNGFWVNPGYYFYIQLLDTIDNYFETYIERIKDLVIRFILRFI